MATSGKSKDSCQRALRKYRGICCLESDQLLEQLSLSCLQGLYLSRLFPTMGNSKLCVNSAEALNILY